MAATEDTAGSNASSSAHPGGHRWGPGVLTETLAEGLDLEQSDVEDALAAAEKQAASDRTERRAEARTALACVPGLASS